jgi:CDGSH iron-sulfur domain-containing protein 3
MSEVTIQVTKNGPFIVKGPIKVLDSQGNEVPLPAVAGAVALCRCGASMNKPFCDGNHAKIKFQG